MWDLSFEDDRAELRRVQDREHPELLAGSPPSDDFSSLLNHEKSANLKTEQLCAHLIVERHFAQTKLI